MDILNLIITYNSEKWIKKNIASIKDADILVVDNGSIDDTLLIIEQEFPSVRLIKSNVNLGFAAANNLGFELAEKEGYDWVFLVNHDAWLHPNCISEMKKIMSNPLYNDFGILSPVHLSGDEKSYDYGFKTFCPIEILTKYDKLQDLVAVDEINGAFMMIRMNCLQKIIGFDPIFFFYGEDVDFCRRATNTGYKIGIVKKAIAYHDRQVRPMTAARLSNHIIANHIIQLKQLPIDSFFKNYLKTIYSAVRSGLNELKLMDFMKMKLYFNTTFYLLTNYNRLKKSCLQYN